jgi:hypothetical protein
VKQQSAPRETAQKTLVVAPALKSPDLDDKDLMEEVADTSPAMKGQYEDNLQRVNQSIREAQGAVDESPNDEDARRSLMDAYHQKAMLFQMAMDRPLP